MTFIEMYQRAMFLECEFVKEINEICKKYNFRVVKNYEESNVPAQVPHTDYPLSVYNIILDVPSKKHVCHLYNFTFKIEEGVTLPALFICSLNSILYKYGGDKSETLSK